MTNRPLSYLSKWKNLMLAMGIAIAALLPIAAGDNYFELSKNMEVFSDIYKELNIYYVDEVNPNELMRTGIDAMLESLDPYTNYYSEAEMESFRFETTGKYGGIGSIIRKKGDFIAIIEPYENSPAAKAGLKAGDLIISVDGKSTEGRSVEDVSKLLKGSPGTTVDLLIRRTGFDNDQTYTLEREDIGIENVPYFGYIEEGIAYITLTQFTQDAGKHVGEALQALQEEGELTGLVLDVRGNPGGLLNEAVNICNLFIDKNKLVVSTRGKVQEWNRDFKTLNRPIDLELPLVVLINNSSASASEIVAGTLQDYDRAVVIGTRSFGKGLVQQTRDIAFNTRLKLTTAKYYTPSGRCIQAIDYAHRNEDGSVSKVPDSLMNEFLTTNGRKVYDGGGVQPDIAVEPEKLSNIAISLLTRDLIFDFVTAYTSNIDSIPAPAAFTVSNDMFEAFTTYLEDKEYDYDTRSELLLQQLEEQTKHELYYDAISADMERIRANIGRDKANDLDKFMEEIKLLLEEEIIGRYYYQNGQIIASFDHDPVIKEAIAVLRDDARYRSILSGNR